MGTQTTPVSETGSQPFAFSSPSSASTTGTKLPQLPRRELGLKFVPAVPVDVAGMVDTLQKLAIKGEQRKQALQGLSKTFTIGRSTARAYNFLYGGEAAEAKVAASH